MDWQELSQKHPVFTYRDYQYLAEDSDLVLTFSFALDDVIVFHPCVRIRSIDQNRLDKIPKSVLDNLVFHLGLIESLSYWKAAAAPTIKIECCKLSDAQIVWWKDLLLNGMGEYLYKNQIPVDFIRNVTIESVGNDVLSPFDDDLTDRAIIPIGGGKDSCVTVNLLSKSAVKTNALVLNPTPAASDIASTVGYESPIQIERTLDPTLLELNAIGYLNGHTPFSAYLAFLSDLCAVLFDYCDIVLSNENSANQGNVEYDGVTINHQYSKTFAFEKAFHDYAQQYLASSVNYFSFLRPVTELQIAKLFAKDTKFFPKFRSCNVGQKENAWCGQCAKCLFVAIILTPFIGQAEMTKIMGKNLFDDQALLLILQELLGIKDTKPFECVGTYEEVRTGLYLCQKNGVTGQLINYFSNEIAAMYPNLAAESEQILQSWQPENIVPAEYQKILKDALHG